MGKSPKILRLSMSSIKKYLDCPMQWYFNYILKIPSKTDYPRLCGSEVHKFIAGLYKKHSDDRKFWYKSIDSAKGAWFVTWNKALDRDAGKILQPDKKAANDFGGNGWVCIDRYWKQNIDKPKPILIEKKYTIPLFAGVELTGVFDQLRTVQLPWLKARRPEIFVGEDISPEYDPYLIVDLKTGWSNYNIKEDDSDNEKVRKQIAIQLDIQAAAYALLYKKHHNGKYPAGFLLYYLREGSVNNTFFVKGDSKESQIILESNVQHVVTNIRNESFPRKISNQCARCDYYMECRPNGNISVSLPGEIPDSVKTEKEEPAEKFVQLKLKFKKERRS